MVVIYVVDNGGQWTHREYRVLRELGIGVSIIPNETPKEKVVDADAIVLSGGSLSISIEDYRVGNLAEYLHIGKPVLGICFGMQFITDHFGGSCAPAEVPEFGPVRINVIKKDDIFNGVPESFIAWENHNDEVKETSLEVLASSENCKVQAVKHPELPIYGLQFHPEVEHTQYGRRIFENFIDIVRDYNK